MKKYFVSFTYRRANSNGDPVTASLLTFEIVEVDLSLVNSANTDKDAILTLLSSQGYNNEVNILHMNPL